MRFFFSRVLGLEADLAQCQERAAAAELQLAKMQALLAEKEGGLHDAQATVREQQTVILELKQVVSAAERSISQVCLKVGEPHPAQRAIMAPAPDTAASAPKPRSEEPHAPLEEQDGGKLPPVGRTADIASLLANVTGSCHADKAHWLSQLVVDRRPRVIGEIGVFGGRSLLPMALAAESIPGAVVYAIDAWQPHLADTDWADDESDAWWARSDLAEIKQSFLSLVVECGLAAVVKIFEMPAAQAKASFKALPDFAFDLLHIDGSHAEGQPLVDVKAWLPLIAPDGIIVLDGIDAETTLKARDYLRARCLVVEEVNNGGTPSYGAYTPLSLEARKNRTDTKPKAPTDFLGALSAGEEMMSGGAQMVGINTYNDPFTVSLTDRLD